MEVPFHGPLALAERLAEHVEAHGLTPIVAHPERAESVRERPEAADAFRERGWLLQVNATSLLGYHGPEQAGEGWRLVEDGLADLVASDGHRSARPPFLDEAYEAAARAAWAGARRHALHGRRARGASACATASISRSEARRERDSISIWRTRSRVMPSRLPMCSSVCGSSPRRP